jgi:hypothetical protein
VPAAALARFLDCSNDLCAAAVEMVDLSVRQRLQQQGQRQQQQHGQEHSRACGTPSVSWRAEQWLQPGAAAGSAAAATAGTAGSTACGSERPHAQGVPDLAMAKQLLAAATGVDQLLKQAAQHC